MVAMYEKKGMKMIDMIPKEVNLIESFGVY